MGEYRYAVVELPPSPYAHDLQEVLAFVFDIGVNLAGCTGEQVAQAFMASGLAEEFEKQNPVYVAGKSSYDLLRIMVPLLPCDKVPAPCLRYDRTPDFWVGWVLAHYQMVTGCSYRSIFATATYDEIRSMYWPLHEAPESKFVAIFDEMRTERAKATNLRTLREAAGLSQSQLAKASGVGVRSIQLYEQRQKDINKAQGIALYRACPVPCVAPWSSCWSDRRGTRPAVYLDSERTAFRIVPAFIVPRVRSFLRGR